MHFYWIIFTAVLIGFAVLVVNVVRTAAQARQQIEQVTPGDGTAQGYIKQYLCIHARTTGRKHAPCSE